MTTSSVLHRRTRYHQDAAEFVFDALRHTQQMLGRPAEPDEEQWSEHEQLNEHEQEQIHITGEELLDGIRDLGLQRYGLLARCVFASWGVRTTEDFGRIVFDLVEEGKMRKTDQDQLSDFYNVYDFAEALERDYRCSTALPSVK